MCGNVGSAIGPRGRIFQPAGQIFFSGSFGLSNIYIINSLECRSCLAWQDVINVSLENQSMMQLKLDKMSDDLQDNGFFSRQDRQCVEDKKDAASKIRVKVREFNVIIYM